MAYTRSIMITYFGEPFDKLGSHYSANVEDFEFAMMFTALTERLLTEGRLKSHPVKLCEGGLQGVLEGVKLMMNEKVSGIKLVYRVADTP